MLRPWEPDVPLRHFNFNTANTWIQIWGAPLEYMTPALAVKMGNLIGEVTAVDRGTATQENLEYMYIRVNIPVFQSLILGVLRLE